MLYQIGDFVKMAQISRKQLKYYERCSLIAPAYVDGRSGYRFYRAEQLYTVAHIRAFLGMGFTTAEIGALLSERDYDAAFAKKREELSGGLAEIQRRLKLLEFYRDAAKKGGFNQEYSAQTAIAPSGTVAVYRAVFSDGEALIRGWSELLARVEETGAAVPLPPEGLTLFWDEEFRLSGFDAELMLFVKKRGGAEKGFSYRELPPKNAVSVIHRGSYEFLHEAYAFAYMWIDRSGYRAAGPPMESYIVAQGGGAEAALTKLYIPIEER